MYYELYIDIFFLENFMMDCILLFLVNRFMKCGRSFGRIVTGGAVGSLSVCLVVFFSVPAAVKAVLFYVAIPVVMLYVSMGIQSLSMVIRCVLLLYLSAVGMGGIMFLFRPYIRNVSLFFTAAILGWVLYSGLLKISLACMRKTSGIVEVELYENGEVIRAKALWDTGNMLTDGITGDPVNILDPEFVAEYFHNLHCQRGYRWIPYRCVGKTGVIEAFRIEKMYICQGRRWVDNPLLGVSAEKISETGEYQIILNPGVQQ